MEEDRQKVQEKLKALAQSLLDMEATRGRMPDETLRSLLVTIATTGVVSNPEELLRNLPLSMLHQPVKEPE